MDDLAYYLNAWVEIRKTQGYDPKKEPMVRFYYIIGQVQGYSFDITCNSNPIGYGTI